MKAQIIGNDLFPSTEVEEIEMGIDHLIISSSQIIKCFSVGLTTFEELDTQLRRWIMPHHTIDAARAAFVTCRSDLRPSAPFRVWVTKATSSASRGAIGLTVDLTGVFGDILPWYPTAAMLKPSLWNVISRLVWEDVLKRFTWSEEFQETRRFVENAICDTMDSGDLDESLAPVLFAMRLCTCEYTEVGTDVLRTSRGNVSALITTPSGTTLCDPRVETALDDLKHRRVGIRG